MFARLSSILYTFLGVGVCATKSQTCKPAELNGSRLRPLEKNMFCLEASNFSWGASRVEPHGGRSHDLAISQSLAGSAAESWLRNNHCAIDACQI